MAAVETSYSVVEVGGGAWYRVQLKFAPKVGELIDLFSKADVASGHEASHRFEVVAVVHKLGDVSSAGEGYHEVIVWVERSNSSFFG